MKASTSAVRLRQRSLEVVLFLVRPQRLALMAATLACAASLTVVFVPSPEVDVWWVAAAGREMIRSGVVPRLNLFSFVEPEHPWIMHEWLLGPLYAWGLAAFGPPFFVVVTLGCFSFAMWLLLAGTVGRMRNPSAGMALVVLAMACFAGWWTTARPTSVALLLPLMSSLLAFRPRFRGRHALAAVALQTVWANVHGSFPLGVLLLGLSAAERRTDRWNRYATAIAAACATLLNPYGTDLHRLVLAYLLGTGDSVALVHETIREFRSVFDPLGATVGWVEIAGLCVVAALGVIACWRSPWRWRGAFCLLLVALGIVQARHVELAGLLGCLLLAPVADRCVRCLPHELGGRSSRHSRWKSLALGAVPLVVGVGALAIKPRPAAPGDWLRSGSAFFVALEQIDAHARLFVPFDQAGLVTWYGYPRDVRIFTDSRNDCYSAKTLEASEVLRNPASPRGEVLGVLRDYGVTTVLIPRTHAIARWLPSEPEWPLHSRVDGWLLFREHTVNAVPTPYP